MENRVSKIIAIALSIGLCGIIVQADFFKIGAGARWAARNVRSGWQKAKRGAIAAKNAAAKSFKGVKDYWDDFRENNPELAFMFLSAAAQDILLNLFTKIFTSQETIVIEAHVALDEKGSPMSYLLAREVSEYLGPKKDLSVKAMSWPGATEEDVRREIINQKMKAAGTGFTEGGIRMLLGLVVPIFLRIMWTEGIRFKGQMVSRVAIQFVLGRALDEAAEKLLGDGQVNQLMYEMLKQQAAALISGLTVEPLLFKGYKPEVADESLAPLPVKNEQ